MDTKNIIAEAAFKLFEELPFEEITVQKILDRAHVSRRTFYKFFPDKYALMHMYYYAFMDRNIKENYDGHNWVDVSENTLKFVSGRKEYINNVKDTQGQDSFWDFLRQYGFAFYRSVKLRNEKREELTERERLTIIGANEAAIAILKQYIEGMEEMDRRETAELICSFIPKSYQELPIRSSSS